MPPRKGQQLSWDDFPARKDDQGHHLCRKCGTTLSGRKTSWCSYDCEKAVLLLVEWRYIRKCILRRDRWRCKICGDPAREVDHIIEIIDGGSFYDWDNLRALCGKCHQAKTNAARTARAAAKKREKLAEKVRNSVV